MKINAIDKTAASPARRTLQLLKFTGKLAITAALLYWVFTKIDLTQFYAVFKTVRWGFLWGVWILVIIVYWLYAVKMRLIMEKLGCFIDTHTFFAVSMITSLYGMVLPGMVDTSIKWYMLKQRSSSGSIVFTGMVYNQFTMMLVIITAGLLALVTVNPTGRLWLPLACFGIIVTIIILCLLLLHEESSSRVAGFFRFLLKPFPQVLRDIVHKIIKELSLFRTAPGSFHLIQLTLAFVGATIMTTIIFLFAAKAARINVPIGILICQCAIISILGRLPISVADLGIREATIVGSLSLYGVDASSALLMSLVILSSRILLALAGAIYRFFYVFRKNPPPA